MDIPLFHEAVSQGAAITEAAQPLNVADRLRRRVLCADIQRAWAPSITEKGTASPSISTIRFSIHTRSRWPISQEQMARG